MLTLAQGLHINLAESFLELHQGLQLSNHPGSPPSVPTGGSPAAQSDSSPASSRPSTLLQLPPHFFLTGIFSRKWDRTSNPILVSEFEVLIDKVLNEDVL